MATFRSDGVTAWPKDPVYKQGKKMLTATFRKSLTSGTNTAGDIFILSGVHAFDARIAHIFGTIPTLAGATSVDIGFYQINADGTFSPAIASGGNELLSAVDIHTAAAYNDLLELNTSLVRTSNIGKLLGLDSQSELPNGTYVGLRTNNQITQATAVLALDVVIEEATTK